MGGGEGIRGVLVEGDGEGDSAEVVCGGRDGAL